MENINKKFHSEKIAKNTEQADVVTEEKAKDRETLTHPIISDSTSMISLEALLPSIVGCKEVWPQKLFTVVIERFGRMDLY